MHIYVYRVLHVHVCLYILYACIYSGYGIIQVGLLKKYIYIYSNVFFIFFM